MEAREGRNSDEALFCANNTRGAKKNKETRGAAHPPLKVGREMGV